MDRFWKMLLLIIFIILLDQFSKAVVQSNMSSGQLINVINGFFNISYVKNTGVAFGVGAGSTSWVRAIFILGIPVFACFYIFYLLIGSLKGSLRISIAYSLILGGAVGNLIDRFSIGYVVDFFDFYYKESHFPSFNIADSCISIAAGMLIIDALLQIKMTKKKKT